MRHATGISMLARWWHVRVPRRVWLGAVALIAALAVVAIALPTLRPAQTHATASSVSVPGTANIFGAGHSTAPDPSGGGAGTLPPSVTFSPGANQVLAFAGVTGGVYCNPGSPTNGPDGGPYCGGSTNITSFGGISGLIDHQASLPLVGVFLDNNEPQDPAPATLNFSADPLTYDFGHNFVTLAPTLGQTFFIGDGQTGTGSGLTQQFLVPPTATRLYLGFADGCNNINGAPGCYDDNGGQLSAQLQIGASPIIADSVRDFSGTQGQGGWQYGFTPVPYAASGFQQMTQFVPNGHSIFGDTWFEQDPTYWTQLWGLGGHPQSTNTTGGRTPVNQFAVRRWVSLRSGAVQLSGTINKLDTGGDGIVGHIYVDGSEVYTQAIDGGDLVGQTYQVSVTVAVGSTIDFAIDAGSSDSNDSTRFTATISGPSGPPPPTIHGAVIEGIAGQPTLATTPVVALLTDADLGATNGDYTVSLTWGDAPGSPPETARLGAPADWASFCQVWEPDVPANQKQCFAVYAASGAGHTYQHPGVYKIAIAITNMHDGQSATGTALAEIVAPAPNGRGVIPPGHVGGINASSPADSFVESIGVVTFRYDTPNHSIREVDSCSATALASVNVIVTARHCFRSDLGLPDNIQFAPGHSGVQCAFNQEIGACGGNPLGYWTAARSDVFLPPGGISPNDAQKPEDAAFIMMSQPGSSGQLLTAALTNAAAFPGLPITFNAPAQQQWTPFGYPTGYHQGYAPGTWDWNLHNCGPKGGSSAGVATFAIYPCDTLGVTRDGSSAGTSGGPWLSQAILPFGIGATNHQVCPKGKTPCEFPGTGVEVQAPGGILEGGAELDEQAMKLYVEAVLASQGAL